MTRSSFFEGLGTAFKASKFFHSSLGSIADILLTVLFIVWMGKVRYLLFVRQRLVINIGLVILSFLNQYLHEQVVKDIITNREGWKVKIAYLDKILYSSLGVFKAEPIQI